MATALFQAKNEGDTGRATHAGSVIWDSTQAPLVGSGSSTTKWGSWLRFPDIRLPQGATIISARIIAVANGTSTGGFPILTKWWANDVDDATNPPDNATFRALSKTTAAVDWDHTEWNAGTEYTSPDIAAIVQEVVDRPGWAFGNALMLIGWDDGTASVSNKFISIDDVGSTHNLWLSIESDALGFTGFGIPMGIA